MRSGKPQIVFVVSGFDTGGAELQLLEYIRRSPDDFDIRVIGLERGDGAALFRDYQAAASCEAIPRGDFSPQHFLLRLARSVRHLRPTIVHSFQDGSPGTWGRFAAWLASTPYILHSDRCHRPPLTSAQRRARPWLDRVTARFFTNAQRTAAWMRGLGVDGKRIVVIPNGVDLKRFDPEGTASDRAAWGIPPDATVAGFLGRLRMDEKRLDVLFDALTRIPENSRPAHVVIGGAGSDAPLVWEYIRRDPWLTGHVRMIGHVPDAARFIAGIDYLVLSSSSEGLPNVVLEAMAMKKPVVVTGVSDLPELVEDAGFVAEPLNPDSLAAAIRAVQDLPAERRTELGIRGRARVEAAYDLNVTASRFWAAHAELCGGSAL